MRLLSVDFILLVQTKINLLSLVKSVSCASKILQPGLVRFQLKIVLILPLTQRFEKLLSFSPGFSYLLDAAFDL